MHWLAFQSFSSLTFLILECKVVIPLLSPVWVQVQVQVGAGAGMSSAGAGTSSVISSLSPKSESIEAEEVSLSGRQGCLIFS